MHVRVDRVKSSADGRSNRCWIAGRPNEEIRRRARDLAVRPEDLRLYFVPRSHGYHPAQIIDTATSDAGPFGEHLRYQLCKLGAQPRLVAELRQIISCGSSADEWAFNELHGAGLVRREGDLVIARCRLYTAYFQQHLV